MQKYAEFDADTHFFFCLRSKYASKFSCEAKIWYLEYSMSNLVTMFALSALEL